MKKPSVQSLLERLPLHQIQQLIAWLTTGGRDGRGVTYDEAVILCRDHFGLKTNPSSLSAFYHRHRQVRPPQQQQPLIQHSFDPAASTLTVTMVIHLSAQT